MKKLIILTLMCSLLLAFTAPVSADFLYERCNADDFVNALVDYCNHNEVQNTNGHSLNLCDYDCWIFNVKQTDNMLDFEFFVNGHVLWPCLGVPPGYSFSGWMHITNPCDGLKKPYELQISTQNEWFRAIGDGWILNACNGCLVSFV